MFRAHLTQNPKTSRLDRALSLFTKFVPERALRRC
jgi:hypothetical protein